MSPFATHWIKAHGWLSPLAVVLYAQVDSPALVGVGMIAAVVGILVDDSLDSDLKALERREREMQA